MKSEDQVHLAAPGGSQGPVPTPLDAPRYEGPKAWTPEEAAQGNKGIRWVTETYVAGRPTQHDVLEYLEQRGIAATCGCSACKARLAAIAPAVEIQRGTV